MKSLASPAVMGGRRSLMGFKARRQSVGIRVTRDPDDVSVERCCFCWRRTAYWYTPKDVACCPTCAEQVTARDVPSKDEWFAQARSAVHHKPFPHWESMAKRDVVEMLVRAALQMDHRCTPGAMARARLIELAKMEDPVLFEKVVAERGRCIAGMNAILADLTGK